MVAAAKLRDMRRSATGPLGEKSGFQCLRPGCRGGGAGKLCLLLLVVVCVCVCLGLCC